jgi:hypothetical protein
MHYNNFKYVVMPVGLTNTHVVFQHLMNDVFHEYLDDFVICYINDILIFSKNMEDHNFHVHLILESIGKLNFTPNWKNMNFINLKWNFLVTSFFRNDIHMNLHKV